MQQTNAELAIEMRTTSRQISKSRRRGWIYVHNRPKRKRWTAPPPLMPFRRSVTVRVMTSDKALLQERDSNMRFVDAVKAVLNEFGEAVAPVS